MPTPILASLTSLALVLVLSYVFHYEEARGKRLMHGIRLHLDYYFLKIEHFFTRFFRYLSMDLLRQVMHYLFHAVLGVVLVVLRRYEKRVHEVQRANHVRARRSRMERTTRNKLDEIAEHKITMALTEEEKRRRREEHLLGN